MNKIPLTLLAVASLIIAAITSIPAQAGEHRADQGMDITAGGVTQHLGPATYTPGSDSIGEYFNSLTAETKLNLIALMNPVVGMASKTATGTSKPTLNHDGKAYGSDATFTYYTNDTDDQISQDYGSLVAAQAEYARNIKSGKWRAFKNGE